MEAHSVERKLAAIFAADVEGYSRLMGRDEVGTLRTLTAHRIIIDRLIASDRGRIFNTAGDSLVADFASAVDAVQCAVAVQDAIGRENSSRTAAEQMRFRIGVHVGDIIVQGDNLFGDAVNIAARREAIAEPGGICVSSTVRDQIGTKLPLWLCQVYVLGTRKGCILGRDCRGIETSIRPDFLLRLFNSTMPPLGPRSSLDGIEQHPVVHIAMKTPKPTRAGLEKNYRPKRNGNSPRAVGSTARSSSGAMIIFPAARRWPTAGRENFHGKISKSTATTAPLQSEPSRLTVTACTTWPATYGNGPVTGSSPAKPTKPSGRAAGRQSIRASSRRTRATIPGSRRSKFRARWSKAARICVPPTIACVIVRRRSSRR